MSVLESDNYPKVHGLISQSLVTTASFGVYGFPIGKDFVEQSL